MSYSIVVHYWIGETVNVDRFMCREWESDISAGVLRFKDGYDDDGIVITAQYSKPWRVLIREVP